MGGRSVERGGGVDSNHQQDNGATIDRTKWSEIESPAQQLVDSFPFVFLVFLGLCRKTKEKNTGVQEDEETWLPSVFFKFLLFFCCRCFRGSVNHLVFLCVCMRDDGLLASISTSVRRSVVISILEIIFSVTGRKKREKETCKKTAETKARLPPVRS